MARILEGSILLILESATACNHKVATYVCRSKFNNVGLLSLIFQVVLPSKFCVLALSPSSRIVQVVNKC